MPQKPTNKDPQSATRQGRKPETHANSDACQQQGWATGKENTQTATPHPGRMLGAQTEKHRHRDAPV